MKYRLILFGLLVSFLVLPIVASAESPYGKIDVYYNDKLYPGIEIAKPNLKIGEPFTLRFDVTMNQYCKVAVSLSELGSDDFVIVDGPSELDESYDRIFMENETFKYEWTLKPTENWAGGTMPLNFHYSILLPDDHVPIVNSKFTAAAPYISAEYYEGDSIPPTTTDPESPTSTEDPTIPSTPAFTILAAALALTIAVRRS